jgi:acyl transferase domain-containing protein
VPLDRWDADHYFAADAAPGKSYARLAAFATGAELFDAAYFRMSRGEAAALDPQARLLLRCAADALRGGGGAQAQASLAALAPSTATYVGCMFTDYMDLLRVTLGQKHTGPVMTGNGAPYQCGRVAYAFGLQGPCVGIDTACSSSLVAAHGAHRGIAGGEAAAAVAGGVNAMLWHETTVGICQLQALSPAGRCQSFDAAADGYGRGEGFAVVVLARAGAVEGASPCALVRGSAVNQDGRSSSLTAPHGPSQQNLVATALASGALRPEEVGLVAVHGTGTPLGDPIEVGALGQALGGGGGGGRGAVTLASVKSCYGHTEGTAGVTGMLFAMAAAGQALAPPVLSLRSVNPYVATALGAMGSRAAPGAFVPRQPAPAAAAQAQPVAGTSSFGMSGVNAHLLLTTAPPPEGHPPPARAQPWALHRFWPVPAASALAGAPSLRPGLAVFSANLRAAKLAFLYDHIVQGGARPALLGVEGMRRICDSL